MRLLRPGGQGYVRRLIIKGEKELAERVYREIFETDQNEAKKAVQELEQSIQEKNIEFEEE